MKPYLTLTLTRNPLDILAMLLGTQTRTPPPMRTLQDVVNFLMDWWRCHINTGWTKLFRQVVLTCTTLKAQKLTTNSVWLWLRHVLDI